MEKLKFQIPKFSPLPNKPENVVMNTVLNASIKTLGFIVGLQALTFVYWKLRMPVGKAIRFMIFKEWLIIPFSYYWYRKLKVSAYEEMDKLDVKYVAIVPVVKVHENEKTIIEDIVPDVKPVTRVVTEEVKTAVKDKLHVSYRLE